MKTENRAYSLPYTVCDILQLHKLNNIISSTNTEVWEFESSGTKIINPTLSSDYLNGIGLFVVDVGYCKKN